MKDKSPTTEGEPSYGVVYNNLCDGTNGAAHYVLLYTGGHRLLLRSDLPHGKDECLAALRASGYRVGPPDGPAGRGWFKVFPAGEVPGTVPAWLLVGTDEDGRYARVFSSAGDALNFPTVPPDCFAALGRQGYKIVGGGGRQAGWFEVVPRTSPGPDPVKTPGPGGNDGPSSGWGELAFAVASGLGEVARAIERHGAKADEAGWERTFRELLADVTNAANAAAQDSVSRRLLESAADKARKFLRARGV